VISASTSAGPTKTSPPRSPTADVFTLRDWAGRTSYRQCPFIAPGRRVADAARQPAVAATGVCTPAFCVCAFNIGKGGTSKQARARVGIATDRRGEALVACTALVTESHLQSTESVVPSTTQPRIKAKTVSSMG
jgi:hypothetical protein